MTLNFHGLRVSQEQIVQRVFGAQVDAPASPAVILKSLSGWAADSRGRFSVVQASPYILRESTIVKDLAFRWPLIVGLAGQPIGHAYVLTGVVYEADPITNEPIIHSAILRDPWPGNPSRIQIPWAIFKQRLIFMTRVHVTRL